MAPLILAMHHRPNPGKDTSFFFELGAQMEWALAGLVISVTMLGFVIGRFISRMRPVTSSK